MENHNVYMIEPKSGRVIGKNLEESRGNSGFEGARDEFLKGNVTVFTLPSGDRIIAGRTSKLSADNEAAQQKAPFFGVFGVLKNAIDMPEEEAREKGGMIEASAEDFLAEFVGPAILVGPKPEGEDDWTPTALTIDDVRRRVAFDTTAMQTNPLTRLLEALLRMPEAPEVADGDNDNRPWAESVYDPELVDYRKTLTDQELADCPCPGCHEEQERRVKAAGGSTLKN
jgi:hypothetical protein